MSIETQWDVDVLGPGSETFWDVDYAGPGTRTIWDVVPEFVAGIMGVVWRPVARVVKWQSTRGVRWRK